MPDGRGQVFAGYRLFIGAILALLILVIIIGGIQAVEEIKYRISVQRLLSSAANAVQSPSGDLVIAEKLTLHSGSAYSAQTFSEAMGIPAACITLESSNLPSLELTGDTLYVHRNIELDVYFRCDVTPPGVLCDGSDIECTVSFDTMPGP